jgi:predicted phage terminase large subunit-like protein
MTRLKPGGKLVLIMTRWHEDDIAGRMLEKEPDKWEILKLPMEAEENNDPLGRKHGERLWPEWFTDTMLEAAKADERTWTSLYQQRPRPMEGAEFKREWLQWYEQVPRRKNINTVMLVDPAAGKQKTSDYTAIWVIGLGQDGNYYVVDLVRDRLNLTERAAAVFRLHKKWKCYEVRYERYGMMGDIEHIKDKMERESYRFRIVEVGGALKKEDRIRRLVPLFQQGRMWFPTELWYTEGSGRYLDLVPVFVEEELLAFPVAKHDDMLDALARIAQPDLELRWPKEDEFTYQIEDFAAMIPEMGY